jgi:hypothetical protein
MTVAPDSIPSIVPSDKSFDIETFMVVIHGTTSMTELDAGELLIIYMCIFLVLNHLLLIYMCKLYWNTVITEHDTGLENLAVSLGDYDQQRESLVRDHFGLFVKCAEGLEQVYSL